MERRHQAAGPPALKVTGFAGACFAGPQLYLLNSAPLCEIVLVNKILVLLSTEYCVLQSNYSSTVLYYNR